jgi:hypothetical protein
MPVWVQEAIASISMLIFFLSAAVLASGDPLLLPQVEQVRFAVAH